MEIYFIDQTKMLIGKTKILGIGKERPKLIYGTQAKSLREKENITIEDLAKEFEVKPKTIEQIENQTKALEQKLMDKYMKKFNVEHDYFFDTDLEKLILGENGMVLRSYETSEECRKAFESIIVRFNEARNNNQPLYINFSEE